MLKIVNRAVLKTGLNILYLFKVTHYNKLKIITLFYNIKIQ